MTTCVAKLGRPNPSARPAMARPRICIKCGDRKPAKEFRRSNRDSRLLLDCWNCRHPQAGRRRNSTFRKQIWAICDVLRGGRRKGKEAKELSIRKQAVDLVKLPERIAAIVGKTYVVMGDDAKLEDDVALMRIRDLLDQLDPKLIERNKNKRLSR
jgi:hypothetical protein